MQQQAPWLAANRYEVGEVVGRGGYGMVCRGVDRKTGRAVALKMLSPEAGRDPDVVERMLREQQALVALSGTCAVTAIDLCRLESGAPCLVMEWLDGCDLEHQLTAWEEAGERGGLMELLALLKPLAETLERAHQIGIVHRDIKPANIFVTHGGGVRLLDFGLSRMKSAAPLTAMGMVMGSPSYIAPETWRGNSQALDGRADLFALAVIAFRWLTGALPFDAPDLIGKMTAVTSGPRPSAVALRSELPATIDAWLRRALAIEPADRFQSGSELYAAFEAALRGVPWQTSADASGVRAKAEAPAPSTPERKNALAAAWSAAASLLKRFTLPRERETPVVSTTARRAEEPQEAPVAAPAPPEPQPEPFVQRNTVWLDSAELEDIFPSPQPEAEPETQRSPSDVPAPVIDSSPVAEVEHKPQAKKAKTKKVKAAPKPRAKKARAKPKPKAKSKAKKPRKA